MQTVSTYRPTKLVNKRFLTGLLKGLTIVDRVPLDYPTGRCIREVLTHDLVYVTARPE